MPNLSLERMEEITLQTVPAWGAESYMTLTNYTEPAGQVADLHPVHKHTDKLSDQRLEGQQANDAVHGRGNEFAYPICGSTATSR